MGEGLQLGGGRSMQKEKVGHREIHQCCLIKPWGITLYLPKSIYNTHTETETERTRPCLYLKEP